MSGRPIYSATSAKTPITYVSNASSNWSSTSIYSRPTRENQPNSPRSDVQAALRQKLNRLNFGWVNVFGRESGLQFAGRHDCRRIVLTCPPDADDRVISMIAQ